MPGLTESQIAQFTDAGCLVIEDVLDPLQDLDPVASSKTVSFVDAVRDIIDKRFYYRVLTGKIQRRGTKRKSLCYFGPPLRRRSFPFTYSPACA